MRGYLTGSLWRDYEAGNDPYALEPAQGHEEGLSSSSARCSRPRPRTPKGKHDEPVSEAEVVRRGLVSARDWDGREGHCARRSSPRARSRRRRGADPRRHQVRARPRRRRADARSTRCTPPTRAASGWPTSTGSASTKGEPQQMLDKENLRQWLISRARLSGPRHRRRRFPTRCASRSPRSTSPPASDHRRGRSPPRSATCASALEANLKQGEADQLRPRRTASTSGGGPSTRVPARP